MAGNIITRNGVTVLVASLPHRKGLAIELGTDGEFKPFAYVRESDIPEFKELWKQFTKGSSDACTTV
jgi:hypothetical protein